MKKLLFLILLLPLSITAQYAVADFIVINEGMEKDYEKLELAWSILRENQIENGQKMNWAVWKRTPKKNDNDNAAHYVVFNQFETKEEMDKYLNGTLPIDHYVTHTFKGVEAINDAMSLLHGD